MALPSYDDIHLPLLKLIHNNSVDSLKEAVEVLEKEFCLTDEDLDKKVKCGVRKFYSQVSFSKKRLIEAGLIFKGVKPFRTTDNARELLTGKSKKITNHDINELIKMKQALKAQREEELEQQLIFKRYEKYLQKLKKVHYTYFEEICGLVLSRMYNVDFLECVEITAPSNDGGIDGIVYLGEDEDSKIYFESKRYSSGSVGRKLVQQFSGALDPFLNPYKGVKGYYITTGKFARKANDYVEEIKRCKDIILIDGDKLVELIFKYKLENEIKLD
ncbi:restriction endonuclease [Bacillus cereus]|uniref:restriction endonuclease n=1 Tax=Bacillus TaxID=1386 RepID=UPI003B671ED8